MRRLLRLRGLRLRPRRRLRLRLVVHRHLHVVLLGVGLRLRRLRSLRRRAAGEGGLRVHLLLDERLRALPVALVEGRAEGSAEVGRGVESGAIVEVLVAVRVRVRVRLRRRRVGRLGLGEVRRLVDDGLVAALHEDGYVPHVGRLRRLVGVLLVVLCAHFGLGLVLRAAVGGCGHGPLVSVVSIDQAGVDRAPLSEVDCVPESVLRQVCLLGGFRVRRALLGLCGGGAVLRRVRRGLWCRLRFVTRAEPSVPMCGEVFSELWRDVVEGESVEAAEALSEICNEETFVYATCER